ncbi:MAG: ATP-binding protein [Gemmatimonadota bacterium]
MGRSRELGALRGHFDRPTSTIIGVTGLPGVGKSALVRKALADYRGVALRCAPLPSVLQREAFTRAVVGSDAAPLSWGELGARLGELRREGSGPFVVVLDDVERLHEARARVGPLFAEAVREPDGPPIHFVLVSRDAAALTSDRFPDAFDLIHVPPLTTRDAARWLPGNQPHHRLRAYGVFGGIPRVLEMLDQSVTVGTNVRRLLLSDGGALSETPLSWLERHVQTPTRYVAALSVLARGDADWGTLHEGVPDLSQSGQLAPYLKRLSELGMTTGRRSLDAPDRSRSRRYEILDPFVRFWFLHVLPWRLSESYGDSGPHYSNTVRPGIEAYMPTVLPGLARSHMRTGAIEVFGTTARETGSLWREDVDIPVAGTLANGAVFYGATAWRPTGEDAASVLHQLDDQIRQTRYGFGRENRQRIVFTGRPVPTLLRREVARRHDALLVDARDLLGERS